MIEEHNRMKSSFRMVAGRNRFMFFRFNSLSYIGKKLQGKT